MKKKVPYIIMGLLIFVGISLLFYPSVSSFINGLIQEEAIQGYDSSIAKMTQEERDISLAEAETYNEKLTGEGITDPFIPGGGLILPENYTSVLDAGGGIMGTIEIPEIQVDLPIFHGTGPEALGHGVGHMEMTAFPIGGIGNHAVLTGHSGIPSSVLFDNLEKLEVGDEFYIKIYGKKLAYRIDQTILIEPNNTKLLIPVPDKDYVSLVTCSPYAINTHRFVVRGCRVPYEERVEDAEQRTDPFVRADLVVALGVSVVVVIVVVRAWKRSRKERE